MSKIESSTKEVVFRIDQEEYAISVMDVVSIEKAQNVTTVPRQNQYMIGVIDLRGTVIPIVDLCKVLSGNEITITLHTRFIIARVGEQTIGFAVDEATDIVDVESTSVQKPTVFDSGFVYGIAKLGNRMIILLDIPFLLENVVGEIRFR